MKHLFALIAFVLVSSSFAAEIKVVDLTANFAYSGIVSQNFAVNPELNRAWVEVSIFRSSSEEDEEEVIRVKIPGLSYDSASETVLLDHEGQLVECARMKETGRWVFRTKKLVLSERCSFRHASKTVLRDNGFEIKEDKRFLVFLDVE